jgi:hypothetical protein
VRVLSETKLLEPFQCCIATPCGSNVVRSGPAGQQVYHMRQLIVRLREGRMSGGALRPAFAGAAGGGVGRREN